jgi:UDP:flavonoid glycosyltransferase YjiC (YdhE family)
MIAFGTRGDVQPALEVASALRLGGVDVRLGVPSDFVADVVSRGVAAVDLGVSAGEMMSSEVGRRWVAGSHRSARAGLVLLRRMFTTFGSRVAGALLASHRPDEAIASNVLTFGIGAALAEARGVPHLQLLLAPITPTALPESSSAPGHTGSRALDLAIGRVGLRAVHWASDEPVNALRRTLALPRWRTGHHAAAWLDTPVVYGFSPHVVPVDPDWPDHTVVTGFWFGDGPARERPPALLREFLASATTPVYVGHGSMLGGLDAEAAVRVATEAVVRAGVHGVVAGPGGETRLTADGRVCLVGTVDHAWLFPRVRAVVHHGGAGTTAQAIRAGVPSTAVPRLGEQPFWGRRLAELGVGLPPLPPARLRPDSLAQVLTGMLDEPMAYRAERLAMLVRQEDGVARAVDAVVRVLARSA